MDKQPPSLMRRGFDKLQEMSGHKQQNRVWNPPSSAQGTPSRASEAIKQFYENQTKDRESDPLVRGYAPEVEELQKHFFTRPGCPKYSHRATSTSHLDTHFARVSELPSNISTISLSSQLSLDDWSMIFQNPELLDSRSYIRYAPTSTNQSVAGLTKWKSYTEGIRPSTHMKIHSGSKIPWYISVLHEKDLYLHKLGEEVTRLSSCEVECRRKEDVISVLREEMESMQKQLDQFQQEGVVPPEVPSVEKSPEEPSAGEESVQKACQRGFSLPTYFGQQDISEEFRQEIERLKTELGQSDKVLDSQMELLNETLLKDQEEMGQLEKEDVEIPQKGKPEGEEEELSGFASKVAFEEGEPEAVGETEEESTLYKLNEFQKMNEGLYNELEKVKNDYDVAMGAICSLQRQLSFEASQLRRAHSEQELLQKELRERGDQLEAMSTKFCNLREERKQAETMGNIERENSKLRQDVSELESQLSEKSQLIEELQSNVDRLQAELGVNQQHVGKQLGRQTELQKQLDTLQRAEQQTRVNLESISARFERFRSKIIQATYSSPATKSPQAEIGDDEVLEALQKIITDRLDFHQLLRQKGVKVPSLNSSEPIIMPSHKKKDPYKKECISREIWCHSKAICQLDDLTSDFYCQCLPGYRGDGVNSCRDPAFSITVSSLTACADFGEQVCLLRVMPGSQVIFSVSVSSNGNFHSHVVMWYKFYSGQRPEYHSYRRRLAPMENMTIEILEANQSQALTLLSAKEDDFYPNLFWAEVRSHVLPEKTDGFEAYDLTDFEILNPSSLRYFFVLDSTPIVLGEFLEGDTVSIQLPQFLWLSPSSFVVWTKDSQPMTLLDSQAVVVANGTEAIEISGLTDSEFGDIRALVYDFSADVPGRVLVAQRVFLIMKDISKTCNGSRDEENCQCSPGFEGNGVHCADIDECKEGMPLSCLPEAECVNSFGSYVCRCPTGLEGDGLYSCIDIDECTSGTYNCDQDATCLNTLGSYFCTCPSGFVGDGVRCQAKSTWSPWSPWSLCSVTCGFQNQMRIRQCTHPESGMRCVGPSADLRLCPDLPRCPTNGRWSEWSPWSACSETCSGIKKRVRECDSPAPARGGLPCQGEKDEIAICESDKCPVDGMWSPWASWTPCPLSCGLGVVSRSRRCDNPAPAHGGKSCSGHGSRSANTWLDTLDSATLGKRIQ
ncbi:coiled-coil domain-containing protein 27 isoform X3 [Hemicordylus capensis]|uniref:coiled-coil domain-containing protein 27 isoform X3 n=1 Tax=Hemicordylus capensis TaxID=884348 RepID=UPI00230495C7|nr:coiled-coil domain-containing protein 27 isoform X3 [Hemicordylus capensis]